MNPRPIAVIGNLEVDLIFGPLAAMPQWGEERVVPRRERRAAGSAGYTAFALGHLGHPVLLAGPIGDDPEGALVEAALREAGLPRTGLLRTPGQTGLSVTLVRDDGERSFVNHLGSLEGFGPDDLEPLWAELGRAELVLLSGYFLLPRFRGAPTARLFRRLQSQGIRTALDTGDAADGWSDAVRAELAPVLAATDWLFPNEAEAAGMAGSGAGIQAARRLLELGPRKVVLKRGARGGAVVTHEGVVEVPGFPVRVVDTVGAGDTFNAGYLAAWAEGQAGKGALAYAAASASLYISSRERRFPTREQVRRFLADRG